MTYRNTYTQSNRLCSPDPLEAQRRKLMSFQRQLIVGAIALFAVAGVAAVTVMHHPGSGHGFHHGGPQALAGDGAPAVHAARTGVAALGKRWNASVRDATTELYGELLRQQSATGIRETANLKY